MKREVIYNTLNKENPNKMKIIYINFKGIMYQHKNDDLKEKKLKLFNFKFVL
jgi:hypothetical protein